VNPSNASIGKWICSEYVILFVTLVATIYFLTPYGFEPGGESFGAWAAARILAETGGFPVFSRSPLYVAYLTLFLKLPFPASMTLEYWILHLFALISIYALVRTHLGGAQSLVLIIVLAPFLGIVEGGGTVAAIGFFSLYLRNYATTEASTWVFLPATLLAAALCHSVYLSFLALHLLVSVLFIFRGKLHGTPVAVNYGRLRDKVPLLLLTGFAVTAFLFQSDRDDHNHMLMDPRFAPIPLSSAINIGFFQIKTWMLVDKIYDPSILYLKDWYFETPKFFGNSKTIAEVLRNNPELFFSIVFRDMSTTLLIPFYLYSFYFVYPPTNILIMLASMLVLLMLLIGMVKIYRGHGVAPLFILSVGCGSAIAAFLLTWFSLRYSVTLLPVFLLAYCHYLGDIKLAAKVPIYESHRLKSVIFILGCALTLSNAPFVVNNERIADECAVAGNPSVFSKAFQVACTKWKRVKYQIGDVVENNEFLKGARGVSMLTAYPVLSKLIDNKTRILSLENTFFSSFTDVDINNNRQIWSLPPYDDKSDYTNNFLNEIDVIFVSENWATEAASVSTQSYLRYKLHVLPYLNVRKSEFDIVQVPSYGKAYIRKNRVQLSSTTSINRD
jgi:hypothetical protein